MAAVAKQLSSPQGLTLITQTIAAPDTDTTFSDVIKEIKPDFTNNNRFINVSAILSASATGAVTVDLYGSNDEAGTSKYQLKANIISSLTNAVQAAVVDLNAYPAPYYFIGVQSDGDDSAHFAALSVVG
jgi:hypothetical protein